MYQSCPTSHSRSLIHIMAVEKVFRQTKVASSSSKQAPKKKSTPGPSAQCLTPPLQSRRGSWSFRILKQDSGIIIVYCFSLFSMPSVMYSPFVRAPGDERETGYNEGSGGLIHPTTYKVQMINPKLTLSTGSSLFQYFLKKTSYRQGYSALFCFEREKKKGKRGG